MKNKKTFLILAVVFVILIIGASVLYKNLSGTVENSNLSVKKEAISNQKTASNADTSADDNAQTVTETYETETTTADSEYQMPDFTVYDKDGNEVKLSDFFGKPIVLNFWASWCGPCKSEMPDFEEAYQKYGDSIEFMMVNLTDGSRETTETAQEFIEEQGYTFPVYFDADQEAAYTYSVYSIPTTYFVDENGNGLAQASGALDSETLMKGLGMISPKAAAQSYLMQ